MFRVASILDRIASRDYQIRDTNVVIEKGTDVYVCLNGLHYDPDYHPEPTLFDPERFNETRKNDTKSGSYIPFGTGSRICLGMRVAMLQIMVGLITILSEYKISWNTNKFKNAVSKPSVFNAPASDFY
ncbi:hypothetical protein TSAR_007279 [Trichomalopsis sarcophagae]|uniref:Cytochrome P450 n=1 Tax=Trichomalopsis sarcophagae TaxID=543379 RepID=A0A232ERA6_9HYME|nr:hypothetical protein TSAR_007279 [Trichomalopsis sarcophagae]